MKKYNIKRNKELDQRVGLYNYTLTINNQTYTVSERDYNQSKIWKDEDVYKFLNRFIYE